MNESCEDNFQDVITELAKPTESSVPDDLLIAYLNKMSRAIDIMLSHNKEHEGLIGQKNGQIFYMECVLSGKPEHTILRLHEKAEIAALLKHGLRAHLITNTMYEIDKDLFLDAHRQAVETEMNFITELKTKLFLKSPIEYLLILFPFYCDDLMRQHGGLSIVDRTKILIGLEKFDDDKFLTAIKEYQMLGMSYSHTSAEILTKLKDVLAKKKATGSIWAIPDKSA